jgi:hypothetical protein
MTDDGWLLDFWNKEVVRRILATAFFETTTVNPRIGGVRVELEHTSISHLILDA